MTTTDPQYNLPPDLSPDDDPLDADLLAEDARRRPGKLTLALAAAIVLVGVFATGVLTQKHFGATTSAAGVAGGLRAGAAGGFPGGGEGGLPGAQGGFGNPGGGAPSGGTQGGTQGGSASSGAASSIPVVVGTVVKVSGTKVTVKNFGGKRVVVTIPKTATVTTTGSVSGLSKGTTVSVAGSTASDGSVTASSVTART